ncbi:MAG: class I SAM-dependent methyltransferase, partial [Patescibacteria group bacterium]
MAELPVGWWYDNDIAFYRRTFESLPNGATTLEIGCWRGRSICSVADIIKKKNITAYVVDTFKGAESEADGAHKEAQELDIEGIFRKAIADFEITDNVKVIVADTRNLKWEEYSIPDKFFDFIFIDGEHTTEAVTNDVKLCLPKLKDRGIMAGHDLLWGTVKAALDKLFKYRAVVGDENIWQKITELRMDENTILMSCWAKPLRSGGFNAKNPSKEYWTKLIKLLKEKGYTVWQAGQGAELKLKTADAHIWDKDLWELGEDIKNCKAWISIDNFFHHWA